MLKESWNLSYLEKVPIKIYPKTEKNPYDWTDGKTSIPKYIRYDKIRELFNKVTEFRRVVVGLGRSFEGDQKNFM